jgi:hypothetical protein
MIWPFRSGKRKVRASREWGRPEPRESIGQVIDRMMENEHAIPIWMSLEETLPKYNARQWARKASESEAAELVAAIRSGGQALRLGYPADDYLGTLLAEVMLLHPEYDVPLAELLASLDSQVAAVTCTEELARAAPERAQALVGVLIRFAEGAEGLHAEAVRPLANALGALVGHDAVPILRVLANRFPAGESDEADGIRAVLRQLGADPPA